MYEIAFGEAERDHAFTNHLDNCAGCKKEFAAIEFAAAGIDQMAPPPAPSLSNERLRTAILSHNLRSRPAFWPRLSFAGAAAALALAAWFGFNQDQKSYGVAPIASVDKPVEDIQPSGGIVIPETPPAIEKVTEPAVATPEPPVRKSGVRNTRPNRSVMASEDVSSEVPDDLLAVVVGGAEGALDADFSELSRSRAEAPATSPSMESSEEKPIVVIQPKGKATERSSDDVPIGG
jgi:hypothetical protein